MFKIHSLRNIKESEYSMKFRPCIDLHGGKVKQIVGGTYNETGAKENFVSEKGSDYYAKLYMDSGLTGGHLISIGKGNDLEIAKALNSYPNGLQIGGGVTLDNAMDYINQGATHVIVTSFIFSNGLFKFENLKAISELVGKDKLVVDLSCRKKDDKYYVVTDRWEKFTEFELNQENIDLLINYCDEFLIHAVDVEGKCNGINEELVKLMSELVTIPCTYAGGIHSIEDIELIETIGSGKIDFTVGSAVDVFGGHLSYETLVKEFN